MTLVKIFEQVEHLAAVEGLSNEAVTGCEDAAGEGRVEGRKMDLDLLASERGQLLLHLVSMAVIGDVIREDRVADFRVLTLGLGLGPGARGAGDPVYQDMVRVNQLFLH